jgi:hypothetical protein
MNPLSILSATLNAATHDAALSRQQAELTLLAVKGFSPSRTGNLALELREIAVAYVAALDAVVVACEIESSPNVVRFRGRDSAFQTVRAGCREPTGKPQASAASVSVFE